MPSKLNWLALCYSDPGEDTIKTLFPLCVFQKLNATSADHSCQLWQSDWGWRGIVGERGVVHQREKRGEETSWIQTESKQCDVHDSVRSSFNVSLFQQQAVKDKGSDVTLQEAEGSSASLLSAGFTLCIKRAVSLKIASLYCKAAFKTRKRQQLHQSHWKTTLSDHWK